MNYTQKLQKAVSENHSCLCVGLDPDIDRIPSSLKNNVKDQDDLVYQFLKTVIDVTSDYCAAFKPNLGFFEALGKNGLEVFKRVIECIPSNKIIIADAKRGDISSTASHYAKAYFEKFNADAVTINPLMGFESLDPFLNYPEKAIYTLALTSNAGAKDFLMQPFAGKENMAAYIAHKLCRLQQQNNTHLGMVVGATKAEHLGKVISHHPQGALLIPGIGTQGGSIEDLVLALKKHSGIPLINSSRSILYAGEDSENWQSVVGNKAKEFKESLTPITQHYV